MSKTFKGLSRCRFLSAFAVLSACCGLALGAWAQSGTTGAIGGKVTDSSGAVVPAAKVTATNTGTNIAKTTVTESNGGYLIPDLVPGDYTIVIEKNGFSTSKRTGVTLQVAHTIDVSVALQVGASTQTVEVNTEAPLIEPQNPNNTTTLSKTNIENMPDAGNDITFLDTTVPGAVLQRGGDTAVSFNGFSISGTMYVVDGADYDDPALNINLEGPTNISMGTNGMSQVSVSTNAYAVDSGRLAGATVNYFTNSGTNNFHGDAIYQWNGRALNAYDYFVKAVPTSITPLPKKPFDNVNMFSNNFGGPIIKNKLFFFEDFEGAQIILPTIPTGTFPSPAWITYAGQQMALGGCDTNSSVAVTAGAAAAGVGPAACSDPQTVKAGSPPSFLQEKYLPPETGANAAPGVNELPFFQHFMSIYGNTTPGAQSGKQEVPINESGCNLLANGTPDSAFNPQVAYTTKNSINNTNPIPNDPGCAYSVSFSTANHTWEEYWIQRVDWDVNQRNTVWFEFIGDRGVQASSTSVIGPVFNGASNQPDYQGNADWTHTFTPTLTNDFEAGFLWYSALFQVQDPTQAFALAPERWSPGVFTTLGGNAKSGRLPTQFQYIDNLTWTKGSHSLKFGENWRKEDVTEYVGTSAGIPAETSTSLAETMYGVASTGTQSFWINPDQRYGSWALDTFAQDTWQLRKNVTVVYGLRASHYSNQKDYSNAQSDPLDWDLMNHSVNVPINSELYTTQKFYNYVPFADWQPRAAISWQPRPNTLVKAGYGFFYGVTTTATSLASNPPFDASFTTGFGVGNLGANGSAAGCTAAVPQPGSGLSPECGVLVDPGQPLPALGGSGAAGFANQTFQSNYSSGALTCSAYAPSNPNTAQKAPVLANGLPACLPQTSLTIEPNAGLNPSPYTEEWSLGVERQLGSFFALNVNYVGNRSLHLGGGAAAYTYDPNAYESACVGCFSVFPFGSANTSPDPRFTTVTQNRFGAYSNYNALQVTATQRFHHGLTYTLNYNYAHCMNTTNSAATSTTFASATWNEAEPLSDLYRDCSNDVRNNLSAIYTYRLPFHTNGAFGKLVNDWQVSGASFAQGGLPIFPAGQTNSKLVQELGPNPAVIIPGQGFYAQGTWVVNPATNTQTTQAGGYQYFNPLAFGSVWDPVNGSCLQPTAAVTTVATEGVTPALCQFAPEGNIKLALRGPGLEWTNFYITKNISLTERIKLRIDGQFYNLFNHANFANPTAPGIGNPSELAGAGEIKSAIAPVTSLLGVVLGGDSSPRMAAIQGKITF